MSRKSDRVLRFVHQKDQWRDRCVREGGAPQVCGEATWHTGSIGCVSDKHCSSGHFTDVTPSHRGHLASSLQTYSSLPAHYAPHNWTSLESYTLSQAINVYALAGTNKDQQWVNIVLKYLKLWSSGSIGESLTRQDDIPAYITNLVESLKLAVDKLSERL